MTPKEKAKELFNKMYHVDDPMGNYPMCFDTAKQCALIAVDEIIEERYFHNEHHQQNSKLKYHIEIELAERLESTRNYWNEVKHEIEKL